MLEAEAKRNELLGKRLVENLKKRNMDACYCATKDEALTKALELIPEGDVVSWGGSETLNQIGLIEEVKKRNKVIDRATAATVEEKQELMHQALLCDTYLMSSNAVSQDGQLVNIDGNGNRCAALIYGPKSIVMVVGMNKVAADLDAAMSRARNTAAPANVQHFPGIKTPCAVTGVCANCMSPETICCQFVITRFSRVPGRIKVVFVGESLGL